MNRLLVASLAVCSLSVFTFAQNTSSYTSTKTSACRTIKSNPDEGGFYEGECSGVAGYKIRLIEGDIRQTINIITPTRKKFELNFWNIFGSFSSVGEKIEWRLHKGVPVAMIARYFVADPEGVKKDKAYLLVTKITKTSACVTDVVDPGADQNQKARDLADASASKPCKTTE